MRLDRFSPSRRQLLAGSAALAEEEGHQVAHRYHWSLR